MFLAFLHATCHTILHGLIEREHFLVPQSFTTIVECVVHWDLAIEAWSYEILVIDTVMSLSVQCLLLLVEQIKSWHRESLLRILLFLDCLIVSHSRLKDYT